MITIKVGKLIPEEQLDNKGKPLKDRRFVLDVSTATTRGELSEGALHLLQRSGEGVKAAFEKLSILP